MKDKHYISAGCVVLRKDKDKILVLLIYKEWNKKDFGWVLPKGTVESGETPEQAAYRETIEETGIENLKIMEQIDISKFHFKLADGILREKTVYWFLATGGPVNKETVKLTDNEKLTQKDVRWFEIDEAITNLRFEESKKLVKDVKVKNFEV